MFFGTRNNSAKSWDWKVHVTVEGLEQRELAECGGKIVQVERGHYLDPWEVNMGFLAEK